MTREKNLASIGVIALAIIGVFYASQLIWAFPQTAVAYYAILAFTSASGLSAILLRIRERVSLFSCIMGLLFLYCGLRYFSVAVIALVHPQTPLQMFSSLRVAHEMMDFQIIGFLTLTAVLVEITNFDIKRRKIVFGIGGCLTAILLFVGHFFVIHSDIGTEFTTRLSSSIGGVAFLFLLLSVALSIFYRDRMSHVNVFRFAAGCIILSGGVASLFFVDFASNQFWPLSLTMQVIGLFLLYVSIALRWFSQQGLSVKEAYANAGGPVIFVFAPFAVVLLIESMIGNIHIIDVGAYLLAHTAATSLSAVLAYLIKIYSDSEPSPEQPPLLFLFGSWTVVNAAEVILTFVRGFSWGESVVPYIVGSFLTTVLLVYLALELQKKTSKKPIESSRWLALGLLGTAAFVILGEAIQWIIHTQNPSLRHSPIGRTVLLGFNLANMAQFVYIFSLLAARQRKHTPVEVVATRLLALWIVPNVLKGVFLDWSIGWWVAELFMATGLTVGLALIGLQYVNAMSKARASDRRASLFADVLMHDVSNYHQAMRVSLELALLDEVDEDTRKERITTAMEALHESERLVSNLRKLLSVERKKNNLEPINLKQSLERACEIAYSSTARKPTIEIPQNKENCYVLANNLLVDAFSNIFLNCIEYSEKRPIIEVKMHFKEGDKANYWIVEIVDYGKGIKPSRREIIFNRITRGTKGAALELSLANALVNSFGGEISIRNRVANNYEKGSRLIVELQAADPE